MKNLYVVIMLTIIVLGFGCKKSSDVPQRLLLSSEIIYTFFGGDTTTYRVTLQHDNQNKLTTVTKNYGELYQLEYSNYSYDENGDVTTLTQLVGSTPVGLTTYKYVNNIPVSASYQAASASAPTVQAQYTGFTNNKVTAISFTNAGAPLTETLTYNKNNYNVFTFSNGIKYQYTFGTHKSPFLYSGLKYPLYNLSYVVNDNEILEEKGTSASGAVADYTYVYQYNGEGYPMHAQISENGTLIETVDFTYTAIK